MNLRRFIDRRPVIVALGGPNGAGKTTFFQAYLADTGLRFVNADRLARVLELRPYEAAGLADRIRRELVARRESFVFETVFSDPVGDKIAFLKEANALGYNVVICFIGLDSSMTSDERVAMRVSQGGHDVPPSKIRSRYKRTLKNLVHAIQELPLVLIYDNSDLRKPFRPIAHFLESKEVWSSGEKPDWFPAP